MRVTWEVEDGYCGEARPQYTEIPNDELADCQTEEEKDRLIEEYVEQDFKQTVSYVITDKTQ